MFYFGFSTLHVGFNTLRLGFVVYGLRSAVGKKVLFLAFGVSDLRPPVGSLHLGFEVWDSGGLSLGLSVFGLANAKPDS